MFALGRIITALLVVLSITACQKKEDSPDLSLTLQMSFYYYEEDPNTGDRYFRTYEFEHASFPGGLVIVTYYFPADPTAQPIKTFKMGGTYQARYESKEDTAPIIVTNNYCKTEKACAQSCSGYKANECEVWKTETLVFSRDLVAPTLTTNDKSYALLNRRYYSNPSGINEFIVNDISWDGSAIPEF